mgnify:CR=1 FL=1
MYTSNTTPYLLLNYINELSFINMFIRFAKP